MAICLEGGLGVAKGYMFWDSETANPQQRICQAAFILTDFEGNRLADPVCELIDPESAFAWGNIRAHGITGADVAGKPSFRRFAEQVGLLDLFGEYILVAHNANGADIHHIRKSLEAYGIEMPSVDVVDTMKVASAHHLPIALPKLCEYYGIDSSGHHDALRDVEMCSSAFWRMSEEFGEPDVYVWDPVVAATAKATARGARRVFSGLGLVHGSDRTVEDVLAEAEKLGVRGDTNEIEGFAGLRISISGVTQGYDRKLILEELKSLGVKAADGKPGAKTDYLAIGDNVGQAKLDAVFNGDSPAKIITTGELLDAVDRLS